jgi:hypothetical protein
MPCPIHGTWPTNTGLEEFISKEMANPRGQMKSGDKISGLQNRPRIGLRTNKIDHDICIPRCIVMVHLTVRMKVAHTMTRYFTAVLFGAVRTYQKHEVV